MGTTKRLSATAAILLLAAPLVAPAQQGRKGQGDPDILATMEEINIELAALGANYMVVEVEFYTIGYGQPPHRILMNGYRWVPFDPYRGAQGDDITYLVVQSGTASGLGGTDTDAAIHRAMETWNTQKSLAKVDIVGCSDPGTDVTVYDGYFGYGFGDPFVADIVHAGWYPEEFFNAVDPPNGGDNILAMAVTFIWVDALGLPTDINGDNYFDTAFVEIYYNDNFGAPLGTRPDNPWGIDADLPGVDVETVALHESGHALGLGHFGPPPSAVMNPYYSGICHEPAAVDKAGMSALWRSWPNK